MAAELRPLLADACAVISPTPTPLDQAAQRSFSTDGRMRPYKRMPQASSANSLRSVKSEDLLGHPGSSKEGNVPTTSVRTSGLIPFTAAGRNDPADQVDCGAGADRHGQRGQVRAPSSGSEPRPTQSRKSPRTLRPTRIPIYGWTPAIQDTKMGIRKRRQQDFLVDAPVPFWQLEARMSATSEIVGC